MGSGIDKIAIFEQKEIRKQLKDGEWWFVLEDVIVALTDSVNPNQYLKNLRKRDEELDSLINPVDKGGVQFEPPLLLPFDTQGGKQKLSCWHTEGIFRLIQSVPSKKAEPFKRWLAKVGYERVQEIENPELVQQRMVEIYRAKGYEEAWIAKRIRGKIIRDELTDEWGSRGVKKGQEYAILTSEISKATFGITPSEYKKVKGIKRENLRDNMTDLELIFTMLGEASTTEIAQVEDKQGFIENKDAAKRGGRVAGTARKQLEDETGKKVVTPKGPLKKLGNQENSEIGDN